MPPSSAGTLPGMTQQPMSWMAPGMAALLGAWLALASSAPAAVGAWTQFRGPTGDGQAGEAEPPLRWSETSNVVWKVRIPGRGRSGPVVLGSRIWLTTAMEKGVRRTRIGPDDMQVAEFVSLRAVCVDKATGRSLWETTLFDVNEPDPVHWLNSWATPTPAVEAGRVYCDFGTFGTACLEADTGKVLWKRRMALDHQVGPGASPVLYKDLLILARDGRDRQFVAALDKRTGEIAWSTDRPPINASSPNLKKSFSTPLLIEAAGRTQLLAPSAHWMVSYDPGSGREYWRARHGDGFSIGTSPVYGQGLAFFGTGCFKPVLHAVRVDGEGDVTATHLVWKTLKQVPVMSSAVLVGRELTWVSDDGMATCAEAPTGQVLWQERLGGPTLASPIAARERIYFFRQDGRSVVVKAGRVFEKLAENALEGTVIATPAMVERALYYRTDTDLYRLEEAAKQ
jgi:hypothetical protein